MKKVKLVLGLVMLGFLGACNGEQTHEEHAHYSCPMECEGDTEYHEDGTCPVCGMDLEEVAMETGE